MVANDAEKFKAAKKTNTKPEEEVDEDVTVLNVDGTLPIRWMANGSFFQEIEKERDPS